MKANGKLVQPFPNYRNLVFLKRFSLCLAMTGSPSPKQLTQATDCPFEQFITTEGLVALTSSTVKKLKKLKQNHLLIQIGFVNYAYMCAVEKKI